MATRTLLNEAIAEAASIREAALANAQAALEESFAPHIKEMFSKKVEEMEKSDADEEKIDEMKDEKHDKEAIDEMDAPSFDRKSGPAIEPDPKKVGKSTVQEEEEVELDALLSQLDEEMDSEDEKIEEGSYADEDKEDIKEAEEDDVTVADAEMEAEDEGHEDPDINLDDMPEEELLDLIH